MTEREWRDQFGTHWEASVDSPDGFRHSVKLTKTALGWTGRDAARAALARACLGTKRKP